MPRVRLAAMWRMPEALLEQAQDDATLLAIRDMERAGIDIITDGEMRRESYSNRFATALEGIDVDNPGKVAKAGGERPCRASSAQSGTQAGRNPRHGVSAPQHRRGWPRSPCRVLSPWPQQARTNIYRDADEMVMDFAVALNEEAGISKRPAPT